jgi:hypothetical protein
MTTYKRNRRRLSNITDYSAYGFTTTGGAKNPYRIIGDTTYILLNTGNVAVVNTLDFWRLRLYSYSWGSSSTDPRKEYVRANTYDSTGHYIRVDMHQLIMGKQESFVIDHINGDHHNNKRSNLVHVTTAENNRNRHKVMPKPLRYDDVFFMLSMN